MDKIIPEFLIKMLNNQYGEELTNEIISGYNNKRTTSLRVNTLKSDLVSVKKILDDFSITYEDYPLIPNALLILNKEAKELYEMDMVKNGLVYFQSLSSMLPPLFLDAKESESILDMAAAPGGKTCQIAAMTNNKASITAIEVNKIRADRLKYNVLRQGASSVYVMNQDAKRLDDYFSFDRILLDAPCSGSGTLNTYGNNVIKGFSRELVMNSAKLQAELLRKALKVLKPGHEMIYSTCSILSVENEEVLKKVMPSFNCEIVPIDIDIPKLPVSVEGTLCVKPTSEFEGFFVAKIRKIR